MKITIKVQSCYGKENIYVVSKHRDAICCLTGKKTIDRRDIEALKNMGFEFQIENEKI